MSALQSVDDLADIPGMENVAVLPVADRWTPAPAGWHEAYSGAPAAAAPSIELVTEPEPEPISPRDAIDAWAEAIADTACQTRPDLPIEVLVEMTAIALRDALANRGARLGRSDCGAGLLERLSASAAHGAADLRREDHLNIGRY